MTPHELLNAANNLIQRPDAYFDGIWPRAAALLARQALETAMAELWASNRQAAGLSAPLATVPQLSAIDAAYPDYAESFGTDGAYSTYGLAVSGQWQTAANWLNAMRTVSEIENGGTGKVVHEVTSTGAVYFGDNSDPGDINETAQFVIAADLTWKWSGDNAVLADNYKFIAGEHYLASLATGPGHLWPVGDGIVENPHSAVRR
jgi:hypothetical protein